MESVMQYLIATYWMWFVVALLVGGVVGFWLPWRRARQGGIGRVLGWAAAAFAVGLVVALMQWLPRRAGLYLETLLLLSFWYAIGGLLAGWLRAATSRAEVASAVLVGSRQPESATLAERAKAAIRSAQDEAASTKAAEDAQSAAVANAAEEARAAAAKAAEDARVAVEAKAAEVMRAAAAAKEERLATEAKAAEAARAAAAAKTAEEVRLAAEAKAAEAARVAAATKAAEEARPATEAKAAEAARMTAAVKAVGEARPAAEAKAAEAARMAAAAKAAAEARLAAEAKAAEEARVAAAAKAAAEARRAAEAKAAEEARAAAAAKAADEQSVAAATLQPDAGTSHPGSKPPGIAAPPAGEADDLKLIKGIGPRNEKACHALGIYQFRQIADWTPEEAIWVGHHMAFPGRIEREHWIAQARLLASGGATEHSTAVKSGSLVVDDKADAPLDPQAAEMLGNSLPEQAAPVDAEAKHPGRRPYGFASAIGKADDLKRIRGIGPQNERRLHGLGIWHFSQIAGWSEDNVKWVGSYLAFSGRIDREKWVAQARELAAGKESGFSRRAASGKAAKSKGDGSS
jgi:predicted flap endonuclease-1-like 5' DNA nuclease